MADETIRDTVRERYGAAARQVGSGGAASCCGGSGCGPLEAVDPITRDLYEDAQLGGLPREAFLASLGCGNPTALADLQPGETVLDLGSGGGVDVLLSAKRVGPTGRAIGLDMTDEMLAVARRNQRQAGLENVEFLKGAIEEIPLPDASVDVIISNCVVNLSGDKDRVLREAFRVLRPGGRFAVADVVLERELPDAARRSVALWTGCLAGALVVADYRARLRAVGFTGVSVEITRRYSREDIAELAGAMPDDDGGAAAGLDDLDAMDGAVASGFIRARRP